ncbi:hypothetical protein DL771_008807 [Monosporascus sp. 5C6A]|nr:hypothetical protein DL771_008807 [Monosporascus sp. 5C6A]
MAASYARAVVGRPTAAVRHRADTHLAGATTGTKLFAIAPASWQMLLSSTSAALFHNCHDRSILRKRLVARPFQNPTLARVDGNVCAPDIFIGDLNITARSLAAVLLSRSTEGGCLLLVLREEPQYRY